MAICDKECLGHRKASWQYLTFRNDFFKGGNILCLDLWKGEKNGDPYLHSIHFAFAFGAFVAPIIAEPFLCNKHSSMEIENSLDTISTEPFLQQNSSIESSQCFERRPGVQYILGEAGYLIQAFYKCDGFCSQCPLWLYHP